MLVVLFVANSLTALNRTFLGNVGGMMIAFAQEHLYGGRNGAPLALTAYTPSEAKRGYRYSCMRVPGNDDTDILTSMHAPLVTLTQQLLPD